MELNADLFYNGVWDNYPIGRISETVVTGMEFERALAESGILRNEGETVWHNLATGPVGVFSEEASKELASNVPADQLWGNES